MSEVLAQLEKKGGGNVPDSLTFNLRNTTVSGAGDAWCKIPVSVIAPYKKIKWQKNGSNTGSISGVAFGYDSYVDTTTMTENVDYSFNITNRTYLVIYLSGNRNNHVDFIFHN